MWKMPRCVVPQPLDKSSHEEAQWWPEAEEYLVVYLCTPQAAPGLSGALVQVRTENDFLSSCFPPWSAPDPCALSELRLSQGPEKEQLIPLCKKKNPKRYRGD